MEQSQLHNTSDTFPNGPSMEYSAEYIEVPVENHAYTLQYEFCPDTFDGYGMNTAYLGGMDVTRNIVDENLLYENFLPHEEYISSDSDDGEYHPEHFHYDYLNNSYQNEWHQDDFYNGTNLEYLHSSQYSIPMGNCTSYFQRGTMYFIPFRNTSNALYTGQVTYTQSQPGLTSTVIQLPDVVQVEAMSESTCTENSGFAAVNAENCQDTIEAETPSTECANAGSPQKAENTKIPNVNHAGKFETSPRKHSPTEAKIQSSEATNAEIPNVDCANKIGTMPETTKAQIQSIEATNAKSPLKAKSTEIPNIDYTDTIETLPGTTKTKTISERDISELANTLSDYTISDPPNSEFQPNASNSNCQEPIANCFGNNTNYQDSLNSNKLGDLQNNGERNCSERIDKDRNNVGDRVENGGYRGQRGRNRRNRGNSRKVPVNSHRSDSNIICFKNFNSRRSYPSSTITFIPNYSLNAKHLNNRNYNNGLQNAGSRQESTGCRQGSRSNRKNSDVAKYREDLTSNKVCNEARSFHCDNTMYRKANIACTSCGASNEVSESIFKSSAAVSENNFKSSATVSENNFKSSATVSENNFKSSATVSENNFKSSATVSENNFKSSATVSENNFSYSAAVKRSLNSVH